MNCYEPSQTAQACVIWMHGLGADADDMSGLADSLSLQALPLRHIFLQAPQRPITCFQYNVTTAWYDIHFPDLTQSPDIDGLQTSAQTVVAAIEQQVGQGISSRQIYLAGFSQGGALALYTALNSTIYLGGIIALSTYLPAMSTLSPMQHRTIPMFFGYGELDPIVWPAWTKDSIAWLKEKGFKRINAHHYPMMHQVCPQEIDELRTWLVAKLASLPSM